MIHCALNLYPITQNEDTGPEGVHDMVNMGKLHEPGMVNMLAMYTRVCN